MHKLKHLFQKKTIPQETTENNKEQSMIIDNKVGKEEKRVPVLGKGVRNIKDLFAPDFNRSKEDALIVNGKYVRSFVVNGFPSQVSIGWLDALYNYDGDMDVALYVIPADERGALEELTRKITQYEAQLATEIQRGSIKNVTRLRTTIEQLYAQRQMLEQNYENLFHIEIVANLYADSFEELNKQTQKLDNRLKGRKINLSPLYLRQDDGYKSALPFGKTYIHDKFRNFNSGALTACFPFYNSEVSHKNGVFVGVNLATMTPVFIDFFNKNLENGNMTVFGKSGSGKTFFVSLLILRSLLKGVRHVIIDAEGEFVELTKAVGGSNILLSPNSDSCINPFDLEEQEEEDGSKTVDIKEKVASLLNLIAVMAGGLNAEQKSVVAYVLNKVYADRGFTADPKSLYIREPSFNPQTGEFYHDGQKKEMPTFSDFHDELGKYLEQYPNKEVEKVYNALRMFKKGGVYDLFDRQTSEDLKEFHKANIVTFDVSQLEESVLRPIGMYIALTWTWEKFIKKNPHILKRVVCDEAWMLTSPTMAGHEFTASFLERAARRIRKRGGALLVASQNFIEFASNPQAKAVLSNATVNVFLKQDATDIDAVQETFKLSDGERNFLLGAKRGEMLIRMGGESSIAYAWPFLYEKELIEKYKKKKAV